MAALRAVKPPHETRTRILDAAEELFMQHGFEATPMRVLIGQLYAPVMARYKAAFERAAPHMPREELVWRMHFMFGTLSYTLAATDTVQLIAGCKPEDRYDARLLEERLTAFLAAGVTAPMKNTVRKAA